MLSNVCASYMSVKYRSAFTHVLLFRLKLSKAERYMKLGWQLKLHLIAYGFSAYKVMLSMDMSAIK